MPVMAGVPAGQLAHASNHQSAFAAIAERLISRNRQIKFQRNRLRPYFPRLGPAAYRRLRLIPDGCLSQTYWVTEGPELNPATQFRELYTREYTPVFRAIRAVVLDSAAAEDLTQETFVRAYKARHRYTPTAPPGAWLRRIGVNLALSYLRRQTVSRFLPARLYVAPDRREYQPAASSAGGTRTLPHAHPTAET